MSNVELNLEVRDEIGYINVSELVRAEIDGRLSIYEADEIDEILTINVNSSASRIVCNRALQLLSERNIPIDSAVILVDNGVLYDIMYKWAVTLYEMQLKNIEV